MKNIVTYTVFSDMHPTEYIKSIKLFSPSVSQNNTHVMNSISYCDMEICILVGKNMKRQMKLKNSQFLYHVEFKGSITIGKKLVEKLFSHTTFFITAIRNTLIDPEMNQHSWINFLNKNQDEGIKKGIQKGIFCYKNIGIIASMSNVLDIQYRNNKLTADVIETIDELTEKIMNRFEKYDLFTIYKID